ncbi:MAG: KEOPS complex subunit Pcc1 [Candidatus Bathyarchaeota archaeon]
MESSLNPETTVDISIHYYDIDTALCIMKAITPDNIETPKGITIKSRVEGKMLVLKVECGRGLGSLIATVDDLLSCIQAAERAIEEIV